MRDRTGGKLAQGLGCDKPVDKICHLSFFFPWLFQVELFLFCANNDNSIYGWTTYEVVSVISNSYSLQNKILLRKRMNFCIIWAFILWAYICFCICLFEIYFLTGFTQFVQLKFSYLRYSKLCKFYVYFETLTDGLLTSLKYRILHSPITFHSLKIKCNNNEYWNVFSSCKYHITS